MYLESLSIRVSAERRSSNVFHTHGLSTTSKSKNPDADANGTIQLFIVMDLRKVQINITTRKVE